MRDPDHLEYHAAAPGLTPEQLAQLSSLSSEELTLLDLRCRWRAQGRRKQHPPEGEWDTWGIMTGRGFGKTLSGAHWETIEAGMNPGTVGHVIAPTLDDVRYTNFEGPTGIITVAPPCLIVDYNKSDLIIYWWNGSLTRGFGSEKPNRLRGPQCHRVWADELGAWEYQEETWDMMEFGLRLGVLPQILWTTTPKPSVVIQRLVDACKSDPKRNILIRGSTDENRENLTKKFYERVGRYRGTKLGRQELEGELIDPEESGIVQRSQYRLWPHDKPLPPFEFIIHSTDTAFSERTFDTKRREPDPSAALVWGMFRYRGLYHVMVLDCWREWYAFPELVRRVQDDMKCTYGEVDVPILQRSLIPSRFTAAPVRCGHPIDLLLIEDKGSGISLRQSLAMENIFMYPYNPGRADKLARLHAVTPMFAHGRVWAPESELNPGHAKTWLEPMFSEVCTYHGPKTTPHDEFVDCTSQALRYFMDNFIQTFVESNNEEEQLAIIEEQERWAAEQRSHDYQNPYNA